MPTKREIGQATSELLAEVTRNAHVCDKRATECTPAMPEEAAEWRGARDAWFQAEELIRRYLNKLC